MENLIAVIFLAMASHSNAEFIERSNEQIAQG